MGNTQGNDANTQKMNFNPDYTLIRNLKDLRYGEVKLVRDTKTKENMILKEVVVNTKEALDSEVIFYNKRITVSHPNIVRIYGYTTLDKQNFCSSYYKISIFIEVLNKDLEGEIAERVARQIPFSESEILLVSENLIAGLSYFQSQGIFHGDLRPVNIFVSNRDVYKLSDPSLSYQKSNGLTNAIIGSSKSFLSPELIQQVPKQDFEYRCDRFKSDVFSMGAILLAMATLMPSEDIFDYENGEIYTDILRERLNLVRRHFSTFTYELIKDMLTMDEDKRPDFISLSNRLLPYQEDIRRKADLPFFRIRNNFEESFHSEKPEDYEDINKYSYEDKENPVLMDFIQNQMAQLSNQNKAAGNDYDNDDQYYKEVKSETMSEKKVQFELPETPESELQDQEQNQYGQHPNFNEGDDGASGGESYQEFNTTNNLEQQLRTKVSAPQNERGDGFEDLSTQYRKISAQYQQQFEQQRQSQIPEDQLRKSVDKKSQIETLLSQRPQTPAYQYMQWQVKPQEVKSQQTQQSSHSFQANTQPTFNQNFQNPQSNPNQQGASNFSPFVGYQPQSYQEPTTQGFAKKGNPAVTQHSPDQVKAINEQIQQQSQRASAVQSRTNSNQNSSRKENQQQQLASPSNFNISSKPNTTNASPNVPAQQNNIEAKTTNFEANRSSEVLNNSGNNNQNNSSHSSGVSLDDLDSKIKAALARSQNTFQTLFGNPEGPKASQSGNQSNHNNSRDNVKPPVVNDSESVSTQNETNSLTPSYNQSNINSRTNILMNDRPLAKSFSTLPENQQALYQPITAQQQQQSATTASQYNYNYDYSNQKGNNNNNNVPFYIPPPQEGSQQQQPLQPNYYYNNAYTPNPTTSQSQNLPIYGYDPTKYQPAPQQMTQSSTMYQYGGNHQAPLDKENNLPQQQANLQLKYSYGIPLNQSNPQSESKIQIQVQEQNDSQFFKYQYMPEMGNSHTELQRQNSANNYYYQPINVQTEQVRSSQQQQ